MNIKYYNLIAPAGIHTEIDVALLKIFMMSFGKYNQIDFYAESEHSSICERKWKENTAQFHTMKLMPKKLFGSAGKMPIRDAISCIYVIKAFLTTKKDDILVFGLAFPFSQFLIYVLSKILSRKNVYVCLHGEMEVIIDEQPFKSKRYQKITKYVLKQKSDIHYIVLGESIFTNLKHLFLNTDNVIVIDHPYEFENEKLPDNTNFSPLILGQIGMGETSKGTEHLFELAKILEPQIKSGKIKIKLVGKLNRELVRLDNGLVEFHTDFLNDEIYKREIQSLHFTLQLVPAAKRRVTASGSFFDTIKYKKPYLSLNNEYINYFHSKQPKSGVLFDTIEEMSCYIKKILTISPEQFKYQYENSIFAIVELQETLKIQNIGNQFRNQIEYKNKFYNFDTLGLM